MLDREGGKSGDLAAKSRLPSGFLEGENLCTVFWGLVCCCFIVQEKYSG